MIWIIIGAEIIIMAFCSVPIVSGFGLGGLKEDIRTSIIAFILFHIIICGVVLISLGAKGELS